jgi:hypothetical protein
MMTVRIEHAIHDYPTWKTAFDRDPADRRGSGVRSYVISQPADDARYVMIDLDFDGREQADAFLETMAKVWASPNAAPALKGAPTGKILERKESGTP